MVENSQNTIYGSSPLQQQIQKALNNVQTPLESQLSRAANVEFVLEHGGSSSVIPLNEINFQRPLTNNLSFVNSQYTLLTNQPTQNTAVANKLYTDTLVQNEAIQRQQADTVLQTNINEEAKSRQQADTTLQTNINNEQQSRIDQDLTLQSNINTLSSQVWKKYPLFNKQLGTYNAETIDSLISGGTGQSLDQINNQYPLQSPLILTSQPVLVGTPLLSSQPTTKQYVDQIALSIASKSLNEINSQNPLSSNLDISASQYKLKVSQPVADQDAVNKLYVDQQIGQQASDQIKATSDPTSRRVITQASEFVALQNVVKQTINETKMVSNIPICYSSYLPQTENFQLTTHEDLSNLQGQLNTEVSDRILADQNLQQQVDVEKGRITDLSNTTYRKWVTGANKETTTYNTAEIDAIVENPNRLQPLNIIQRFLPLNSYLDLRIGNQPTYCQTPVEDPQIVPKSYVDTSISNLKLNTSSLLPNGSVGFNNQRITNMAPALNSQDAMNLAQTQQLVTEATSFSLAEINQNYPSDGQILNLVDADVRVSQTAVNLNNPVSLNQFNNTLTSYLPTSTKLNQISAPNGNLSLANQRIVNLAQPIDNYDAVSKLYVDEGISSLQQPLNIQNAFYPLSTDLSFLNNDYNLLVKNPTQNAHPTTRQYVDTQIDNERAARQDKDDQLQAGLDNRYIKWVTGGNQNNSTYNVSQINALVQNPDNYPPLNVIQNVTPLNSYLDLRISNYPTYCVQPTENDQLANKIYVDNKVSALKLNTVNQPDGSVGLNNQRLTNVGNALNDKDAVNLLQLQQTVTEATSFSLSQINQNYSSVGQIINLQGVDVQVESQNITSVNNPVSIQYLSDQLQNYYPNDTALNQIDVPVGQLDMNQQTITNLPQINSSGNLGIKTNNGSNNLTISQQNGNYTVSNNGNIQLQSNGIITLNAGQYTQSTTPIYSNSTANQSANQVLNRQQNDARYYQNTTRINEIQSATGNIAMNGFTLSNIRDAVDILEPTNLAQVTSLIANTGFKNKIQSQSNHAQVICNQGSDIVEIKANNADSTIVIQASGSDYTIGNTGKINLQASELNVNQNALRVVGNGSSGSILLASDLRSTALDLNLPDQILTRSQNDARYLSGTTSLNQLAPPDASVSFGNQLLRNLQNPQSGSDASTKAYIDNTLINYPTTASVQANFLTKSDAAATYQTSSQVDSKISTALIPYSTSSQIASIYLTQSNAANTYITPSSTDIKISTALVPYLTQSSAASIYRPLSSPDNKIQSTDGNTQLLANTGSAGISIKANGNQIGSIFQAIGQTGFTPLVISATDKLQFISNEGSTSFTSGPGDTTNGIYIASNSDNPAAFCWDQLVIGSGSNRQGLVLSSGHTSSNLAYNAISSDKTSNTQSLTITPETSAVAAAGGNQFLMYGDSQVSNFPIQNLFNKRTGRTATQSNCLANEFLTKGLADTLYTGGGIQTLIRDSGSNNSVSCSASNPGIILTNLQNILTSVQFGSATSTGVGISFQSASGATGGINALSGANYIEHISNGQGFKFMNNLGSGYMFLKSTAKATSDGTSQVVFIGNPQISVGQTNPASNELLQAQYADARYSFKDTALNNLAVPSGNLSLNNFLITNLASGTIASGNTSSITGGNVYDYIATLPSIITQQVYTVTINGSSTNGFQWTAFTNTAQTGTVQCQRVKGSGSQMITSSVITSQSQTLVPDFATLQFQVSNANIRVTQVVPYTTTVFTTPGQQNIASMTFSQQAISSTATCVQLYKPQGNQGSAVFILYVYVDQF